MRWGGVQGQRPRAGWLLGSADSPARDARGVEDVRGLDPLTISAKSASRFSRRASPSTTVLPCLHFEHVDELAPDPPVLPVDEVLLCMQWMDVRMRECALAAGQQRLLTFPLHVRIRSGLPFPLPPAPVTLASSVLVMWLVIVLGVTSGKVDAGAVALLLLLV